LKTNQVRADTWCGHSVMTATPRRPTRAASPVNFVVDEAAEGVRRRPIQVFFVDWQLDP
jgi:hypothetical protein